MDETNGSLRKEKLNDTNFHTCKNKMKLLLSLRELQNLYMTIHLWKTVWILYWHTGGRKARVIIGLSPSTENLENFPETGTAREILRTFVDIYKLHALLNFLDVRRNFYISSMREDEKILLYINQIRQLSSTLQ